MSQSKTPQFDSALDEILQNLTPHTRTCLWAGKHEYCEGNFAITDEDIEFLKLLRVPAPHYCPTCRRMRRFPYMNLTRMFKRKCDVPGHTEQMISILPPECPFPVYEYAYYISEFDALMYGRDYISGMSPMEQLYALRKVVPMPSFLNRDPSSINSDYSNGGKDSKNCYYTTGVFHSENVWYSGLVNKSKDVMDSRGINKSDTVYGSLFSDHLYKSSYCYFSSNCSDSTFLFDCRNCQDCYGGVNLRNKRYVIFNEQKTKEEYEAFIKERTFAHSELQRDLERFFDLVRKEPMNASRNMSTQNVTGVLNENCRNMEDVTSCENSEHVRHADGVLSHKDSMDVLFSGGNSELLYQANNIGSASSRVKFSVSSKTVTDCEFIFNCKNLTNCFMCIGLHDKSFCILNKQYTAEEYWELLDIIKRDMLALGEYGECAPLSFNAQAYNYSLGGIYFPLPPETVRELGGYIAKEPTSNNRDIETLDPESVPETIQEVDSSIVQKAIRCEKTGRPFRIIPTELDFYKKMNVPLPRLHPALRLESSYTFAPAGKYFDITCARCSKNVQSLFSPADGYTLYCESCYSQEVL